VSPSSLAPGVASRGTDAKAPDWTAIGSSATLGQGFLALVCALAPALAAIWTVSWFVTQDGPAHIYNAQILAQSLVQEERFAPLRQVYSVRWQPIPNWAGPMSLALLLTWLPAWLADRIVTSVTLAGFALAVFWLRWRVAGGRGLRVAAIVCALLAMNMLWLYGFASFMLGACLLPITLAVWWPGRDHMGAGRVLLLAALLAIGYFCHLVSVGLTVMSLMILALTVPPANLEHGATLRSRIARLTYLSIVFLPLALLIASYLAIARQGGPMRPVWENPPNPWLPAAWSERLSWVDPVTIAIRFGLPFTEHFARPYIVFAPVIWLGAALFSGWWSTRGARTTERRNERAGWLTLAVVVLAAGVIGPDSLGPAHGQYLPQRVILLGLAALVPAFDVNLARWSGRASVAAILTAVALQSAIIWDYAIYSDRTAGQIIAARDLVGENQRIVTVLASSRSRFRANPLLHAENWLGVDTDNIVWHNYETLYYYFPVQFRPGIKRPDPSALETISIQEDQSLAEARTRNWERILTEYADTIDVVVIWKSVPALEAITVRWFDHVERRGDVQVYTRGANRKPG
jgi:hypothetical protein